MFGLIYEFGPVADRNRTNQRATIGLRVSRTTEFRSYRSVRCSPGIFTQRADEKSLLSLNEYGVTKKIFRKFHNSIMYSFSDFLKKFFINFSENNLWYEILVYVYNYYFYFIENVCIVIFDNFYCLKSNQRWWVSRRIWWSYDILCSSNISILIRTLY